MSEGPPQENGVSSRNLTPQRNTYLAMTSGIQALIVFGLILFVLRGDRENVFLTVIVMGLTLVPAVLFRRHRVLLPLEFQLIAATFIFLSLFLGSAFDFYYKLAMRWELPSRWSWCPRLAAIAISASFGKPGWANGRSCKRPTC